MLKIRLFGVLERTLNDQPMPPLHVQKAQWLLTLLALRRGREVNRDWLAGVLWPDSEERKARRNLRQCLTDDLRPSLGQAAHLLCSPSPSTLMLHADVWVDVLAFDAAVKDGQDAALEQAVVLHRRPLLESCYEEWIVSERASRTQAYLAALEGLAQHAALNGAPGAAVRYLRLAVAAEPFRESAYCALMQALAEFGDQDAVKQVYRDMDTLFRREFAHGPAPETEALYRSLSSGARRAALPVVSRNRIGPPRRFPVSL